MIGYEGAPRYPKCVQALTGDDEIVPPGITLESDRPEYSYSKRERLWALTYGCAASPANLNQFLVSTGAASGSVISIITHILSTVDAVIGVPPVATAGFATPVFAGFRDGRNPPGSRVAMTRANFKQTAVTVLGAGVFLLKANVVVQLPFIASAVGGVALESLALNVAQVIYLAGYERVARPEEIADA